MPGGKRRTREITDVDVVYIRTAVGLMEQARDILVETQANNAAIAVRKALKSVQGALRHADLHVTVNRLRREREKANASVPLPGHQGHPCGPDCLDND